MNESNLDLLIDQIRGTSQRERNTALIELGKHFAPYISRMSRENNHIDPEAVKQAIYQALLTSALTYTPNRNASFNTWLHWHFRTNINSEKRAAIKIQAEKILWFQREVIAPRTESDSIQLLMDRLAMFSDDVFDLMISTLDEANQQIIKRIYQENISLCQLAREHCVSRGSMRHRVSKICDAIKTNQNLDHFKLANFQIADI